MPQLGFSMILVKWVTLLFIAHCCKTYPGCLYEKQELYISDYKVQTNLEFRTLLARM